MEYTQLARLNLAVRHSLSGGDMIAFVPNPRDNIDKPDEGYWERSFIVAWGRKTNPSQPSPDGNGYVYGTHRVHVNSNGDSACFTGNYDMGQKAALWDMTERAGISKEAANA